MLIKGKSTLFTIFVAMLLRISRAEEEHSEVSSPASVAIAATLLGSVSFMMTLYYCTNHPDDDMKKYSYEVISKTISIFCAVLLFQSCNDLVEFYFDLDKEPLLFQLFVDFSHLLLWYGVLQLAVAFISGALHECVYRPSSTEFAELNAQCFAVLLAHMTGFASINAFGTVQQLAFFRSSWWTSALVVPIASTMLFMASRFTAAIRKHISLRDDGEQDEYEQLWDETTKDAEDDVMGLTISFISVQSMKYGVSGFLANQEGEEPWQVMSRHGVSQSIILYLIATILAISTFTFYITVPVTTSEAQVKDIEAEEEEEEEEKEKEEEEEAGEERNRKISIARNALGMSYAWSNFYALVWCMAGSSFVTEEDSMLLAVLVAMLLSFSSFSLIWVLDKLADEDWTPDEVDDAIRFFITAIGVLVGFAWEQCFDKATASLSSVNRCPHTTKVLLAIFCGLIIVPAWRIWILPMACNENWKFGFVVSADEGEKWNDFILDDKFKQVMQSVQKKSECKHRESMAVKGLRKTPTMEMLDSISSVARSQGKRYSNVGYDSFKKAMAPDLPGRVKQFASGSEYKELPASEVEELKLKNLQLQATLAEVLEYFNSHIEHMHDKMSIMEEKVPAECQAADLIP